MGSQKNVNRPEVFLRSRLNRWKALCLGCSTFLICRCLGTKQVGVPSSNGSEELYIRGHDGNPCHFKQKYIYRLCVYLCLFLSLFFYIHRSRSIYKQPTPVGRLCILTSKKKQGTAVGRKVQLFFFSWWYLKVGHLLTTSSERISAYWTSSSIYVFRFEMFKHLKLVCYFVIQILEHCYFTIRMH